MKGDASWKFQRCPRRIKIRDQPINSLYYTKFGQLIIRKIIKIMATKHHILRLKCTKFDSDWGSAGGALAGFKGRG